MTLSSDQLTAKQILSSPRPDGELCVDGDIQLGNLVFNSTDSDGTVWIVSDLEGWWTLPEPDIPDYPLGADDGSYETAGRYNARIFTISGVFMPSSPDMVAVSRAKLIRAADLCRRTTWFLARQSDFVRGSQVVLSGAPMINTTSINGRTEFSIGLKASDPIKYAINGNTLPGWYEAQRSGSGSLSVVNEGDYPVKPILTISGSTYGQFNITNETTGEVLEVRKPIAGSLVIDNKMRSVTLDGQRNQRAYLDWDTDWLSLAPGSNTITVGTSTGDANSATVTFQYRHGWIG
jgi:hypothetical protein